MGNLFNIPNISVDQFGRTITTLADKKQFENILGNKISDIINFEDGNDELLKQGRIILPRHYHIFEGIKNGEVQFKPYEYDPYRIVVATYNDVIVNIESIG